MDEHAVDVLAAELEDAIGTATFSGVASIRHGDRRLLEVARGLACRAEERPINVETRLATASGTKGFTALTVASLIEDGVLDFDTPVTDIVGGSLPLVDPAVTIEHLLGHTSGVGDYLAEDEIGDIDDHVLDVPVHELEGPEDYLPMLNRHPQTDPPGIRFSYNNSGYIMLALIIERVAVGTYHDEVRQRVFEPAGMVDTAFLRSDRLPGNVALGYLADGRTNVFHLPVVGTGDGGAYTTAADMHRFWETLFSGAIVDRSLVEMMTSVRNEHDHGAFYGLGFWIGPDRTTATLEGMDAGVSLRSGANPATGFSYCFIANNSADVWPLAKIVDRHLRPDALEGGSAGSLGDF